MTTDAGRASSTGAGWEHLPLGIYLEIDTYADLLREGTAVAEWVERARREVIIPLITRLFPEAGEWPRVPGPKTDGLPWGAPNSISIEIGAIPARGASTKAYAATEQNWHRLLEMLATGRLSLLRFQVTRLDTEGLPHASGGSIVVDLKGVIFPGTAHTLALFMPRPSYGERFAPEQQATWVELLKAGARTFDAAWGHVTIDRAGRETAHELTSGLTSIADGLPQCRTFVRGYAWANILSREHIAGLGGFERVRSEAPCHLVEDLSDGRGEFAYLQLTRDAEGLPDDALRALKAFLAPVLLRPRRADFPYYGPPLRAV